MSNNSEIFIPNSNARKSLAKKLELEYHQDMQDWEWEISDYKRIEDFFNEYDKVETSINEKSSLMEIILDCLNDLLHDKKQSEFDKYFKMALERIELSGSLHKGSLNYWVNNGFTISSEILKTGYNTK